MPERLRYSLVARASAFVAAAIALAVVILCSLVLASVRVHFDAMTTAELEVIAAEVGSRMQAEYPSTPRARLVGAVSGHHGFYFRAFDADGRELSPEQGLAGRTWSAIDEELAPQVPREPGYSGLVRWAVAETPFVGRAWRLERGGHVLVAADVSVHATYLDTLSMMLAVCAAISVIVAGVASFLAIRAAHAPLRRLTRGIEDIRAGSLDARLDDENPRELQPIVSAFNHLLDELAEHLERLSNFNADVAHDLRTPITNLTLQTQVALSRERGPAEYREVLYSALEEYERLSRMINDMLFVALADQGGLRPHDQVVEMDREITNLTDFFGALADENRLQLVVDGSAGAVPGDELMLRRMLSNVLSNALRHAHAETAVRVELDRSAEFVTVRITNDGETLDPAVVRRAFDRFYRSDPARTGDGESSGLGLTIARSIADAHGGSMALDSLGGRTTVTITLPLGSSAA